VHEPDRAPAIGIATRKDLDGDLDHSNAPLFCQAVRLSMSCQEFVDTVGHVALLGFSDFNDQGGIELVVVPGLADVPRAVSLRVAHEAGLTHHRGRMRLRCSLASWLLKEESYKGVGVDRSSAALYARGSLREILRRFLNVNP
jgi:hypothetical protein